MGYLKTKLVLLALLVVAVGCAKTEREEADAKAPTGNFTALRFDQFGVVIGGSISEGRPALYGLYHGQKKNKPGQISYYLETHYNIKVLNYGVGGQTCTQVASRFEHDALEDNPAFVWLNCGHNDINKHQDPKPALQQMVDMANAAGVTLIIQTVGKNRWHPEYQAEIDSVNEFIRGLGVKVVDFDAWANTVPSNGYFADNIHPTKMGYENFMNWAFTNADELANVTLSLEKVFPTDSKLSSVR